MKVFITDSSGFIGSNLAKRILTTEPDTKVIGLDNMNDYYGVRIKEARLAELQKFENYTFIQGNLADKELINSIFQQYHPSIVVIWMPKRVFVTLSPTRKTCWILCRFCPRNWCVPVCCLLIMTSRHTRSWCPCSPAMCPLPMPTLRPWNAILALGPTPRCERACESLHSGTKNFI